MPQDSDRMATSMDPDRPKPKRRKHFGVRYGAAPVAGQQAVTSASDRPSENRKQVHKQPINHQHAERVKAEAQLQGRKFHLNTSSCVLPDQDQLFASQTWSLPDMMIEKEKLNDTKTLLDCKDIK